MRSEYPEETVAIDPEEKEALLLIAHGAVVTGSGISLQRAFSVALEAVLARGLGPAVYGIYAFGWRVTAMILRFSNLGGDVTLLRDIPSYADDRNRQRRSLGLAYVATAVMSVTLAAAMVIGADALNARTIGEPQFPPVFRLFAVLLVLLAFIRLHAALLKATEAANGEVLLNRVLRTGVRLVAAIAAIAAGAGVVGVVQSIVLLTGLLAVGAYPIVLRSAGVSPTLRGLRSEAHSFFDHAVPTAASRFGGLFRTRVDVLLIGWLLTATAAGIYNVVLVLVVIAAIPLHAFNQLMPPVAAGLYANGRIRTLDDVYTTVTRLIVTSTVPIMAVLVVYGEPILGIFGAEFRRGYAVLLVFLVGRFIGNAVGATGYLLAMTNNQYPRLVLEWFLAALNLVLTYVFVLQFGLIGAALGTSLAIGIQNLLQAMVLRHYETLWPFDRTFFRPIAAGVAMVAVMLAVHAGVGGVLGLGIGTGMGVITYGAVLVTLGIDPRDRFILGQLRRRYTLVLRGIFRDFAVK